jgi:hypothetical protein
MKVKSNVITIYAYKPSVQGILIYIHNIIPFPVWITRQEWENQGGE